uniref:Uncharacterized protein n=4 Tax=Nymphaea colorata TaxID=210225 RepID=A0A5K1H335_9MAGN|nr:unnamed protein product [Nymphaea colorata]
MMTKGDWETNEKTEIWEWKMPASTSSSSEICGSILPGLMLSYDDLAHYLRVVLYIASFIQRIMR